MNTQTCGLGPGPLCICGQQTCGQEATECRICDGTGHGISKIDQLGRLIEPECVPCKGTGIRQTEDA